MWSGGSKTKLHIEEANRHLVALMNRIHDLEKENTDKDIKLKQKEDDYALVMQVCLVFILTSFFKIVR